jgi:hypothetical protein
MPGDASRKNGAKGGRPKGRKNNATLEREAVSAEVRQRIMRNADRLVTAQLSVAEGCSFLFRREKNGKYAPVKDETAIAKFLNGELDPEAYEYIYTERPNNFAIQDMLNRALGKPVEQVDHKHTGPDGGPVQIHHHFATGA